MVKRRGHLGVIVDTFPLRITTTGTGRPRYPAHTQTPGGNGGEGGATGYSMKALQLVPSGCFSQSCPIMPPSMPCSDAFRGATEAVAALACSWKCPASTSSLFADMMKVQYPRVREVELANLFILTSHSKSLASRVYRVSLCDATGAPPSHPDTSFTPFTPREHTFPSSIHFSPPPASSSVPQLVSAALVSFQGQTRRVPIRATFRRHLLLRYTSPSSTAAIYISLPPAVASTHPSALPCLRPSHTAKAPCRSPARRKKRR